MNLFDTVSQDLFKPLTGIHKRQYMELIMLLWDRCKRKPSYGEEKSAVLDLAEGYFCGLQEEMTADEDELEEFEGDSAAVLTPRDTAGIFIRRLRATGWLEEREGGYEEETSLVINHRIVPLIRAFGDMIHPKMTAYKGKLFKSCKLLEEIGSSESPYESVLREVSGDMDELNMALRQLSASIGQYIDDMTRGKTPREVLDLFETYEEKVVVGAYHRFKTNDNLFYYRQEMLDMLEKCRTVYFEKLIEDCAAVEQLPPEEAAKAVLGLTSKIEEDLQEMREIVRVIDERHILYRTRAVQRAQFLLLSDGTVKSKLSRILQYLAESDPEDESLTSWTGEPVAGLFQFWPQAFMEERSLKPPTQPRRPTQIEALQDLAPLDPQEIAKRQEQLMRYVRSAVTAENVNRFAAKVLKDRQTVTAEQLAVEYTAPEDIVKIIGLHTYSTSAERQYDITMQGQEVERGGLRFKNFTVMKRG